MRINYSRVVRQANEIDDLGDELKKVADDLGELMVEIPATWRGSASEAYLKQCEDLKRSMKSTSRDINNVADLIKRVAKRIHDEDEEEARRAQSLKKL